MSTESVPGALEDHAAYQSAERECDVVMKGGVTSGIVYPHAICRLAQRFRLRSVGGTSAGAIAAACAAAAELGRAAPDGGFARLARMPRELAEKMPGGRRRLLDLFQPARATRPLFEMFLAVTRRGGKLRRFVRASWCCVRHGGWRALLGALPAAIALAIVLTRDSAPSWPAVLAVVLLLVVGVLAGGALRQLNVLLVQVPATFFGICPGTNADPARPALTDWLHEQIQRLAGRKVSDPPLTFGDLAAAGIDLQVVTSCITHGRPYGLPRLRRTLYFSPDEFRQLFPKTVVKHLEDAGGAIVDAQRDNLGRSIEHVFMQTRLPLPKDDALPVLVAVRMSLAFPVLLGAVPLWDYDWRVHGATRDAWRDWAKERPDEWQAFLEDPTTSPDGAPPRLRAERIWFSDGGISSNFPIHLFDAPVPTRPTVGIDLRYHEPETKLADDARVELAQSHSDRLDEDWGRLVRPDAAGHGSLVKFLARILGTMQNWSDTTLTKVPGYRDRFASVHLQADEGGTNLEMDSEVIAKIAGFGARAGELLRERFEKVDGVRSELTWTNHRWVRLRTTLAAFEEWLHGLVSRLDSDERPSFEALVARGRDEAPTSYPLTNEQREAFHDVLQRLRDLRASLGDDEVLAKRAPRPRPELRIVPRIHQPARTRPGAGEDDAD